MFIVQKLIWFIFGNKRAVDAAPNAVELSSSTDAASPRRVVALLNVGATENLRHLPRIGLDRAWSKASFAEPKSNVLNMMARAQTTSAASGAPGLARPDYSNHRRLTALR